METKGSYNMVLNSGPTYKMRAKRVISVKDAVNELRDGMTVGLSGFSYMNPPMEFVREIIRQGKKNLTLVSGPTSGIETDLLIGAECVKKVVTAGVAFEKIAGIAPNFRKAVEECKIEYGNVTKVYGM